MLPRMHLKTLGLIAQICHLFQELVRGLRTNNIKIAKRYKAKQQFLMSLKCYQSCLDHGNTDAMWYFGYLCRQFIKRGVTNNFIESYVRAAEGGNPIGMVLYACNTRSDQGDDRREKFIKTALASGNARAIAECYYWGLGTARCSSKAIEFYKIAAEQNDDEYCQFQLGLWHYGNLLDTRFNPQRELEKVIFWLLKAAKQGHINAQKTLSSIYNTNADGTNSNIWNTKAQRQIKIIKEFFA